MSERQTTLQRETRETRVKVSVNLDGKGESQIDTGIGFLDHMLELFSRHSGLDLEVKGEGDLHVDEHHLVEDVGLVLGQAVYQALGAKTGIERYGSAIIPMDEVLVAAAVDLSGRFAFVSDYSPERAEIGDLPTELVAHFFRSLASELRANVHFKFLSTGENEHHRVEAMFKAFARALRSAIRFDERRAGQVPSTKGIL
ncbi:MAG: imidazoleglycerol-phosphate dehydratase HisB [Acidobacteriota bacterium]